MAKIKVIDEGHAELSAVVNEASYKASIVDSGERLEFSGVYLFALPARDDFQEQRDIIRRWINRLR